MGKGMSKEDVHRFYSIKEKLGMGSFAVVKRAIRKSDKKQFAVKEIRKLHLNEEELKTVEDEVSIMENIAHPNCVKLYEMYTSKAKVYMVLELLTGGELFDRIVAKGNYSEKEAATLLKTLLEAIKYLHSINIVHRDLKPENLLYTSQSKDADIKITDFGLAKARKTNSQDMHTACGTPGYVAPEVLEGHEYGAAVDLWSIGVILYILLCGFPPFYHEATKELYKLIKKGKYDFPDPYWKNISSDAKDVVTRLLTVDPAKRATPDDILNHPWLGGNASAAPLGTGHGRRMKLRQAKQKLRKGVRAIIAVNRFGTSLSSSIAMHT